MKSQEKTEIRIIGIEGGYEIIAKFVNGVKVWTKRSPIRYYKEVRKFN